MRHDSGLGVIPPDFILDTTLTQLTKARVPSAEATAVKSIARRAAAKNLGEATPATPRAFGTARSPRRSTARARWCARCARRRCTTPASGASAKDRPFTKPPCTRRPRPASARTRCTNRAGPGGRDFGAPRRPAEAQGMTKGTVGERMAALYKDPTQLYPNTDAGKAQAASPICNGRLAAIRGAPARDVQPLPACRFEVRRVPPHDRGRRAVRLFRRRRRSTARVPALVYFNLRDSAEWPKFCLPTTDLSRRHAGPSLRATRAVEHRTCR